MDKETKELAVFLKDDLEPLLTEHLSEQIATLVINYGYTRALNEINGKKLLDFITKETVKFNSKKEIFKIGIFTDNQLDYFAHLAKVITDKFGKYKEN